MEEVVGMEVNPVDRGNPLVALMEDNEAPEGCYPMVDDHQEHAGADQAKDSPRRNSKVKLVDNMLETGDPAELKQTDDFEVGQSGDGVERDRS